MPITVVSCSRNKHIFRCDQNGPPARREEGAYLNRYVTDEQRSCRPIFIATLWAAASWLFFDVARSSRIDLDMLVARALTNSQLTCGERHAYFGNRTLERFSWLLASVSIWFFSVSGGIAQFANSAAIIAPGAGIGQVRIGENLDDVHRALGTPKLSDAAMGGRLLEVWRSGPAFEGRRQNGVEQLEIYFRREGADLSGQLVVRQIRVTSPFFRTLSGISVRSSFVQVYREFPNLSNDEALTGALNGERSEKEIEMFVDRPRGIAFEFRTGAAADPDARGYCRAIHIFAPNTNPRPIQNFEEASKED